MKPPVGDFVEHRESPVKKVAANTYLGYGPLGAKKDRTALDPAKAHNRLHLRIGGDAAAATVPDVQAAIQLAAWFGGLGSRARNGFGSLHWEAEGPTPALHSLAADSLDAVSLDFQQALRQDWPHAIGLDLKGRPLVWRTAKIHPTWLAAMKELAILKIALRTSRPFEFTSGGNLGHPQPLPRHVLAYPAGGKHAVDAKGWGKDGRMANQLRLRLHREAGGFRGVIVHVPCGVPSHMRASVRQMPDEQRVWATVHDFFDHRQELIRLGGER